MAPHSNTLAWKIPWKEESGRLQSMGSLRVGHDWATSLSLFTFMHWRRKWQPLQCSCLENPRDRGAWWAAIYGVAQSQTWLKRLSSSNSSIYITFQFAFTTVHRHSFRFLLIAAYSIPRYTIIIYNYMPINEHTNYFKILMPKSVAINILYIVAFVAVKFTKVNCQF